MIVIVGNLIISLVTTSYLKLFSTGIDDSS